MLGTVVGAGLSYWITQSDDEPAPLEPGSTAAGVRVMPQLGWMGRPMGFGVTGAW